MGIIEEASIDKDRLHLQNKINIAIFAIINNKPQIIRKKINEQSFINSDFSLGAFMFRAKHRVSL